MRIFRMCTELSNVRLSILLAAAVSCVAVAGCSHDVSDIEPGWGNEDGNGPPEGGSSGSGGSGGTGGYSPPNGGSGGDDPHDGEQVPEKCGNGRLDEGEECDGDDLGGEDCRNIGYVGGQLKCFSHDCTLDTSGCTREEGWCGNNRVDDGEQCDGNDLDGQACSTQGFDGGDLQCQPTCNFTFADCWNGSPDDGGSEEEEKRRCRDESWAPTDNTCRECVCEWCPSETLNCDDTCWGYVGCVLAFCSQNADSLSSCAMSTPCSQEYGGGETGAMGLLGSDCEAQCLNLCANVERRCGGDVVVSDGRDLARLAGCSVVEGSLWIQNSNLSDLNGLRHLSEVQGDLSIDNNHNLYDLSGLGNLHTVRGTLTISYNNQLGNVDALSNLRTIGEGGSDHHVQIQNNPSLTTIQGLSGVSTITGDLNIDDNDSLYNLSGLEGLQHVGATLSITDNDALDNINALSNLDGVGDPVSGGDLYIRSNSALSSIWLTDLGYVGGSLEIEGNPSLGGSNNLNSVATVGGRLYIYDNDNLTHLDAFNYLGEVGADLTIEENDNLESVGLASLTSVQGSLSIRYNRYALTDLSGLGFLSSVKGELYIEYNDSLVNLGLGALSYLGSSGYVNYNSQLPSCQVDALMTQLGVDSSWPFENCGNYSDECSSC